MKKIVKILLLTIVLFASPHILTMDYTKQQKKPHIAMQGTTTTKSSSREVSIHFDNYQGPLFNQALKTLYKVLDNNNISFQTESEFIFDSTTPFAVYVAAIDLYVATIQDTLNTYKQRSTNINNTLVSLLNTFAIIKNKLAFVKVNHVFNYASACFWHFKKLIINTYLTQYKKNEQTKAQLFKEKQWAEENEKKYLQTLPSQLAIAKFGLCMEIRTSINPIRASLKSDNDYTPLKQNPQRTKYDHTQADSYIKYNISTNIYRCIICKRTMRDKTNIRRHVKAIHLKIAQYKCTSCDSSFLYHKQLQQHRKTTCVKRKRKKNDITQSVETKHPVKRRKKQ